MSAAGVPIEKIARLVGHTGTATTDTVYREQLPSRNRGRRRSHRRSVSHAGHRC
jgi:hypothetical protein